VESTDNQSSQSGSLATKEALPRIKRPSMYKVVLLNDDFTTFDFVVEVLKRFFRKTDEEAQRITLEVHEKGKGIAGVFTRDVAETKMHQVNHYARSNGHPLTSQIEEA
jgi:ATP-dependent Clp protease adaptor protein ClpS